MSAEQLGKRIGVTKQAIANLERREPRHTVSLDSLERAAQAMGCRLVYALVPDQSLEEKVDERARATARRQLARVGHSMLLEAQKPPAELHERQLDEVAQELKRQLRSELWDDA